MAAITRISSLNHVVLAGFEYYGCVPVHGRDLPTALQDRHKEAYKHFLKRSQGLRLADGIVINSFVELESTVLKALMEESSGHGNGNYPSLHLVGPIVLNMCESNNKNYDSEWLKWLDEQTTDSVVFVSFGSGGTISQDQMNELALGLEMSCQKFLWIAREPNELPSANYFCGSSSNGKSPLSFLPCGFLERITTKGQGFVIPSWAPQVKILSHEAIGGFITQCGWFSTLESIVHGLPIIAWPLFAEQKMIATMLADGLKVAIRPEVNESSEIVEKGEVAKVVKSLMTGDEGKRIRERMKMLKDAAADALKEDGSSTMALSQLATKLGGYKENLV